MTALLSQVSNSISKLALSIGLRPTVSDENNNGPGVLSQAWQECTRKDQRHLVGRRALRRTWICSVDDGFGHRINLCQLRPAIPRCWTTPMTTIRCRMRPSSCIWTTTPTQHLHQDYLKPWNRGVLYQISQTMHRRGAKAVVFDIVFSDALDTNTDQQFADAMRENGNVIIADDWTIKDYGVKGKSLRAKFSRRYWTYSTRARPRMLGLIPFFLTPGKMFANTRP